MTISHNYFPIKETFIPGIYRLDFPVRKMSLEEKELMGWITNEEGDWLQVSSGKELEIQCVCTCKKKDLCEAGNWCPGRFRVMKPFQGLFCLVLYDKCNPGGCLNLSLMRSLRWKDGKLLRRMNLDLQN